MNGPVIVAHARTFFVCGALVLAAAALVLRGFLNPLLWATVVAAATWPLYCRFAHAVALRASANLTALAFTALVGLTVLGPIFLAVGTLVVQTERWIVQVAMSRETFPLQPGWLSDLPWIGPTLAERWRLEVTSRGDVSSWLQRADTGVVLSWAQALGEFASRHAFRVVFAVLALFFAYRHGEALARNVELVLGHAVGERGTRYLGLATRSVRSSVLGTLVVGLFDGLLAGIVYWLAGVPHPQFWGALTGLFAAVPFLGYVPVIGITLFLAAGAQTQGALIVLCTGVLILFVGDKILRPLVVAGGTQLGFAWTLMGTIGGFEVLGLPGIFIGPVVLTLAQAALQDLVDGTGRSDPMRARDHASG